MKLVFFVTGFVAICMLALMGTASAQASRTWISGVGDDANPCSRTAPCKTFAGAISKTATGGEINCIDTGGFGALTITKAIAIICDSEEAGVLVSGTNGFTINAGATDQVYLSGLDFEGLGTSLSGISVLQVGTLHIVNSKIRGFQNGISVTPGSASAVVDVINTIVADNSAEGITCKPTGGAGVRMMLDSTRALRNGGDGVMANGNGGGSVKVSIRNSEASSNGAAGFVAFSSTSVAQIMVDESSAFNNNFGIQASGGAAIARFTRSSITGNTTGVEQDSGGQALSYGTNSVDGNGADGVFGTTPQK